MGLHKMDRSLSTWLQSMDTMRWYVALCSFTIDQFVPVYTDKRENNVKSLIGFSLSPIPRSIVGMFDRYGGDLMY